MKGDRKVYSSIHIIAHAEEESASFFSTMPLQPYPFHRMDKILCRNRSIWRVISGRLRCLLQEGAVYLRE